MVCDIEKTDIIVKIYALIEPNNNNSGKFSESIWPGLLSKNVAFLMNWEKLIPLMSAVGDGLQKMSLLVLKA